VNGAYVGDLRMTHRGLMGAVLYAKDMQRLVEFYSANAVEREWEFEGAKVCDGHDPEGNVFQIRQAV
jgi:hypothetical protein